MSEIRKMFEKRCPNPLPDKLVFGEIIDQDMWAAGALSEAELIITQQYHARWLDYRAGAEDKESISCTIPSATMEHEFQRHYRHGWENGVQVERERRIKLVALLREAVLCPEIGCSLSDDIKAAIVEAEKLK